MKMRLLWENSFLDHPGLKESGYAPVPNIYEQRLLMVTFQMHFSFTMMQLTNQRMVVIILCVLSGMFLGY